MKLLFEEYGYPAGSLKQYLPKDIKIKSINGNKNEKVTWVGYFFNKDIKDVVFIMPKVFISENKKAFNRYDDPSKIIDLSPETNPLKANGDDEVVFELSAWLYQAIKHFSERKETSILDDVEILDVKPNGEIGSKTLIEIMLSLREFQKKHRNLFTYIALINSSGNNKIHWAKTVSKVQPVIQNNTPYYLEFRNKNKVINFDEELVVLFYSVLNYLSQLYHFRTQPVEGYDLLRPSKIQSLIDSGKGTRLLKKIRHNYFTDELVQLWKLLYEFFEREEMIGSGKQFEEMLLVSKFDRVFEDMIDQLISDDKATLPKELLDQKDGKRVDHIYKDQSIIEEDRNIYFIGDSKYYKETTALGDKPLYKQFTYAKNVIQNRIDIFNKYHDDSDFRYRDTLTEGYNVTPNFFIRGVIDFNNPRNQEQQLRDEKNAETMPTNEHFFNRLFDRDTLFLQSYNINFMYVVASYINNSDNASQKKAIQIVFRNNFISYISGLYDFSVLEPKSEPLNDLVEKYFKKLIGKIYQPNDCDNLLILALDKKSDYHFENFQIISQIENDFYIYDYQLGTDPKDVVESVSYHYLNVAEAAEEQAHYETKSKTNKTESHKRAIRKSVLFGIYKDQDHFDWIIKNKQYNVRLDDRAGAIKQQSQVFNVSHLVLYNQYDVNNYTVYNLNDKHETKNAEQMKATGYKIKLGGENNKYFIYNIEGESDYPIYGIESILKKKREEFEKANNEPMAQGTPIYVYEDELK